ncbi:hypothetical protein [Kutzneria buriramensis]|uniref:SdrD B-like protein n=1 Tax=Kutzneria buriramensis TaxID=1045776 RepID=A0A3E0HVS3_9PSEU|nr:hypothetical protein [Kutzneria buriramensis]REH50065.1 hypothetical protein BCF44_104333 [Kutzneria buriramensis]
MGYSLLRRIAVGSGALTVALTTAFGGVAAAVPQSVPSFDLTVALGQSTYNSGDDVTGSITITNTGSTDADGLSLVISNTNLQPEPQDWMNQWYGGRASLAHGASVVLPFRETILDGGKPIAVEAEVQGFNFAKDSNIATAAVIATRGSVDGVLYLDANGNGQYDAGEGLAGIDVSVSGGAPWHSEPAVKTNQDGHFAFTDIPSGAYSPAVDAGLVLPYTTWHVKDQTLPITLEARHKVSDALTAVVALDSDTYAADDTTHTTVTLTNNGDHDLPGITAKCDLSGEPNTLGQNMTGWGDLQAGQGVTVPAHATLTRQVSEPVPAGALSYGHIYLGCLFGQFGAGYEDGAAVSNTVSARVTA